MLRTKHAAQNTTRENTTQFQSCVSNSKTHHLLPSQFKLHLVVKNGTTGFHINFEPQEMMSYCT